MHSTIELLTWFGKQEWFSGLSNLLGVGTAVVTAVLFVLGFVLRRLVLNDQKRLKNQGQEIDLLRNMVSELAVQLRQFMTEAKGATAIANKLKDVAAMGSEEVARQQKVRAATSQLKNAIGNLHGTKIRIPFDTEIKLASPILIAPLAIIALMYFISPLFVLLTLFFMGYVMFGYFELRSDTKDGLRIDEHRSQAEQIGIRAARASLNHREWSELLSWWANQYQSAMVRKVADSAFIAQTQVEAEKPIKQTA